MLGKNSGVPTMVGHHHLHMREIKKKKNHHIFIGYSPFLDIFIKISSNQ